MALPSINGMTIHSTLGALFVGYAVACCIYGILLTQIFGYFRRYPLDKPMYKIVVVIIGLLETLDQVFIGHIIYFYSIVNFANPVVLLQARTKWSLILQLTVGAIVGAIVKASFAVRVWRFSGRNIYITGLIFLLTFGQLGLAMTFTVKAFELPDFFSVDQLKILGSVSLGTGVLTDIVTAAALCYYLNKLRTGYKTSDSLVNSLCRYAINTGLFTSTVSLATLVLYNAISKGNLYYVAVYFVLSKLYAISYLATLNTRRTVRGQGTDREATTNNTNMFHLGTRVPTVGRIDVETWNTGKLHSPEAREFPFNTFAPPTVRKKPPPPV
ncbi:hypothetical protein AMATHDRAFT_191716 [Amanita thiersii Skay4041]|uniref:DUF6534 domain-containing protein n=1 Tax=Amanita thiersii Skay4041 TaxID=703135 RepID=A0A2A9NTX6_9AGAR|nr:hypothetical protein AMATHDRAFT_191716 [Amanita thiersii Skay4041]